MNSPASSYGVSNPLRCHSGLDPESRRRPNKSREPFYPWTPAFAGVTVFAASCGELTLKEIKKTHSAFPDQGRIRMHSVVNNG
jgi:hypothetical protein